MIRAYIGNLGMGKTLNMVNDCMIAMKRGKTVISNTPINFCGSGKLLNSTDHKISGECPFKRRHYSAKFYDDGKDFERAMIYAKNAIIAVDEAGLVFDSALWKRLPFATKAKMRQSRKDGCDFFFTAQGFSDVVPALRRLCNEVVYCRKRKWFMFYSLPLVHFKPKSKFKFKVTWISAIIFVAKYYDPEIFHRNARMYTRRGSDRAFRTVELYPATARLAQRAYDTMKQVNYNLINDDKFKLRIEKTAVQTRIKKYPNSDLISRAEEALKPLPN